MFIHIRIYVYIYLYLTYLVDNINTIETKYIYYIISHYYTL